MAEAKNGFEKVKDREPRSVIEERARQQAELRTLDGRTLQQAPPAARPDSK